MATISFYSVDDHNGDVLASLQKQLPEHDIHQWPDPACQMQDCKYAICWHPPEDFFTGATQLQAIFSMAAGVDHLLLHPTLPANVPILRLCDAGMGNKIAEYVHYGVMTSHRGFDQYRAQQKSSEWLPVADRNAADYRVGIMGFGVIGRTVAHHLHQLGYKVSAWRRTQSNTPQPFPVLNNNIDEFLNSLDVLVGVLPATEQTKGIFNQQLFQKLPTGAHFINVGRGSQVIESELLQALNAGQIKSALLDVFVNEPLAAEHPFWDHPNVTVTPHIAGPTQLNLSVAQIVESIRKLESGVDPASLDGLVSKTTGY